MPISESQLETWSHIGAQTTAKLTHESVRNAIDSYEFPDRVYKDNALQGSYKTIRIYMLIWMLILSYL